MSMIRNIIGKNGKIRPIWAVVVMVTIISLLPIYWVFDHYGHKDNIQDSYVLVSGVISKSAGNTTYILDLRNVIWNINAPYYTEIYIEIYDENGCEMISGSIIEFLSNGSAVNKFIFINDKMVGPISTEAEIVNTIVKTGDSIIFFRDIDNDGELDIDMGWSIKLIIDDIEKFESAFP
jgi:hypothetical protein